MVWSLLFLNIYRLDYGLSNRFQGVRKKGKEG